MTEHGKLWLQSDNNVSQKAWTPRKPDKRGRDDVETFDLEILIRKKEKNREHGGYFNYNKTRASTSMERNKQEPKNVSSSDIGRPTANFPVVDLKEYEPAEKQNITFR